MDVPKTMAVALALNRTAFGLNYLVRPEQARTSWIGRAARLPGAQVMIRSQGIRDVVLGAGALRAAALGDADQLRTWAAGHAVCDAADLLVTWLARDRLPAKQAQLAMAVAAGSTVVGAAAASLIRPPAAGPSAG